MIQSPGLARCVHFKGFDQQKLANRTGLSSLTQDPLDQLCCDEGGSRVLTSFNLNGFFSEVGHGSDVDY